MARCNAIGATTGERCKRSALPGTLRCKQHSDEMHTGTKFAGLDVSDCRYAFGTGRNPRTGYLMKKGGRTYRMHGNACMNVVLELFKEYKRQARTAADKKEATELLKAWMELRREHYGF